MRLALAFFLVGALTPGCVCDSCPPGTRRLANGRCVGTPLSERHGGRSRVLTPADLPKRAPLAVPELKPLPAMAEVVFGGATPRWYESMQEVRVQADVPDSVQPRISTAWRVGPAYALTTTPTLDKVPVQVDYFFLGDNLIGFGIRFFVADGAHRELWDRIIEQARKRYGLPQSEVNENIDWTLPHLAVHAALTSSGAASSANSPPVFLGSMHFTVPPPIK